MVGESGHRVPTHAKDRKEIKFVSYLFVSPCCLVSPSSRSFWLLMEFKLVVRWRTTCIHFQLNWLKHMPVVRLLLVVCSSLREWIEVLSICARVRQCSLALGESPILIGNLTTLQTETVDTNFLFLYMHTYAWWARIFVNRTPQFLTPLILSGSVRSFNHPMSALITLTTTRTPTTFASILVLLDLADERVQCPSGDSSELNSWIQPCLICRTLLGGDTK